MREARSTSQDIIRSARRLFAERGYVGTTMRAIAQDACVDTALIHHYFITKENLFAAAIGTGLTHAEILEEVSASGPGTVGIRLLRSFLRVWDDPSAREPMLAVVRSAMANHEAAGLMRDPRVVGHVVRMHTTSQHELRTALVGSQVLGVLMMRYVLRIEPVASLPPDTVAAILGPALDICLADDLPYPAGSPQDPGECRGEHAGE